MNEKVGASWVQSREKRITDLAVTGALAPIAIPASAVAGAAVSLVDRTNPIFMQDRVGQDGEAIRVPKLRTLPSEIDESSPGHRGYDDPRASIIGRFLRKSHMDELPQGLLVLRGKMSLVGPRPMVPADFEATMDELSPTEQRGWLHALAICRPGGVMPYNLSQHDGSGSAHSFYDRAMIDTEYSRTASRKGDLGIITNSFLVSKLDLLGLDVLSRPGHPQSVEAFSAIAEKFGVNVTDKDIQYWRAVLNVGRVFDDYVDKYGVENLEPSMHALLKGEPIDGLTREEAEEFRDVFFGLRPEKQSALLKGAELAKYAPKLKKAENVDEFIEIRSKEVEIFAEIMSLPPVAGSNDYGERRRFNSWVKGFIQSCYAIDSLVDLKQDRADGNIGLVPTPRVYASLAIRAIRQSQQSIRDLPPSAYPRLAKISANKAIRNHLRNRRAM